MLNKQKQYHLLVVYCEEISLWEIDLGDYDHKTITEEYKTLLANGYKRKHLKKVSLDSDRQEAIDQYMRTINNPSLIY